MVSSRAIAFGISLLIHSAIAWVYWQWPARGLRVPASEGPSRSAAIHFNIDLRESAEAQPEATTEPSTAESAESAPPSDELLVEEPANSIQEQLRPAAASDRARLVSEAPHFSAPVAASESTTSSRSGEPVVESSAPPLLYRPARYRFNPAPEYPEGARQRGWEGTVLLIVSVDSRGNPVEIAVRRSSQYGLLDEAAVKTVKGWIFEPAQMDSSQVASKVEVPVRFYLSHARR